mmetsp:Transcript_36857/g.89301  ORF Transcript_36857/g.89301 Transcript_36857/m.89301 type:complete len:481 (-) Transcript_36857:7941-9383(-)
MFRLLLVIVVAVVLLDARSVRELAGGASIESKTQDMTNASTIGVTSLPVPESVERINLRVAKLSITAIPTSSPTTAITIKQPSTKTPTTPQPTKEPTSTAPTSPEPTKEEINTPVSSLLPTIIDCSDYEDNDYKLALCVHNATSPVRAAGQWVYRPEDELPLSPEHLQCLDKERQGNCHNVDAWKHTNDTAKLARHNSILNGAIANSPGILRGHDPWVWESNFSLYQTLSPKRQDGKLYATILEGLLGINSKSSSKLYLVGDSLTRQWAHTIHCELVHVLNRTVEQANAQVMYIQIHDANEQSVAHYLQRFHLPIPAKQDYVVWNTGHHVGPGKVEHWQEAYKKNMEVAHNTSSFDAVPDSHIFFRTTSVRHFLKGRGDWNTKASEAGGVVPDMDAHWDDYGGSSPAQPTQNQIALNHLHQEGRFNLLDVSPMMLARADASFDGSHFCLPGPMAHWSRLLYYRIQQLKLLEKKKKGNAVK